MYSAARVVGWLKVCSTVLGGKEDSAGRSAAWASCAVALKVVKMAARQGVGDTADWVVMKISSVSWSILGASLEMLVWDEVGWCEGEYL